MLNIGIDMGGQFTKICLMENKNVIYKTTIPTPYSNPNEALEFVVNYLKRKLPKEALSNTIGLAIAGPVLEKNGEKIISCPNIKGWEEVPAERIMKELTGTNVVFMNDANAYTYGEWKLGAGREFTNFILLTFGTGIGGGIVIDNKLYTGAHGLAGEPGHIFLSPDGPECACGNKGCMESFFSNNAFKRIAKEYKLPASSAKEVFELYLYHSNKKAEEIIKSATYMLARGVASLIHLLDPEAIIIGGGISKAGVYFLPLLKNYVNEFLMPLYRNRFRITLAALGEHAAAIGMALYAHHVDNLADLNNVKEASF